MNIPQIRAHNEQPTESFFVSEAGVVLTFDLGSGLHITKEIPASEFDKLIAAYGKKQYETQEAHIDMLDTQIMPAINLERENQDAR